MSTGSAERSVSRVLGVGMLEELQPGDPVRIYFSALDVGLANCKGTVAPGHHYP